jgi:hypothetical protein
LTFNSVTVNGAIGDGVTTVIVVDSTVGLTPKMVLFNNTTRENLRIVTVDSATQITVTRAFGRVAGAAIADNEVMPVIGTAFEEGSARPVSRGLTTTYVPNYTQIFRNAWALTDTARASATEMGFTNVAESKRDCMLLHSVDIESAILFGQAKMDTSGSQPVHATQGIIDAIEQYAPGNTNAAAATTSQSQLETLLEGSFTYSTDLGETKSRMLFGGSTAIKVINEIARKSGIVEITRGQTGFGFRFSTFDFYKGSIYMVEHPILNGIPEMAGMAIIVDMPGLKLAYMEGRDTRNEEFGGVGKNNANGVDAEGGSLTTELAVELLNPAGCAVIYDLSAGVADA